MENTKQVSSENIFVIARRMAEFQQVHNQLRMDFKEVYELASRCTANDPVTSALIRACIKELFSLIEADIFLYNQYNGYLDFDDKDSILDKFKRTFKHHATDFNKSGNVMNFNSRFVVHVRKLKRLRDDITHPKSMESIVVTADDLKLTWKVYEAYTDFISSLMTGTAISATFH